jgi:hypothetical protein
MIQRESAKTFLFTATILVAGLLPLLLYWPAFHLAPSPGLQVTREIGTLEQWLVVITAFGVKPGYMLLSLVWIIWLWRRTVSDLVSLRWGLIFFLGGEIACAANYVLFAGNSAVTDYFHSYGMAVGFSFIAYAALEGIDFRLIKYTPAKDRCAALSLCHACIKYADVPCGLRRLFSFFLPALMVVSLMLPCAELRPSTQKIRILDSAVEFANPMWAQLFENRYCAWLSLFLLLLSWGTLLFKQTEPVAAAKVWLAAALGPLAFGLTRLFLRTAYRDNLPWANIWEELTELLFIAGVGIVLWVFRGVLFQEER